MQTLLILLLQLGIIFRFGSQMFSCKAKEERGRPLSEMLAYRKKIILVSGRAVIMSTRQAYRIRSSPIRYFKPYKHVLVVIQG